MSGSMARVLVQRGIQRYKNLPRSGTFPGFNNASLIRSMRMTHSMTQDTSLSMTDECRELMAIWPDIVRNVTEAEDYRDIPDTMKWMAKLLEYNVPNSQKLRAIKIMWTFRMLAPPEQVTDENLRLARIVAWCHEINQTFMLMQDDMMDHSELRRGQPCWYLCTDNPNSQTAINDCFLLEQTVFQLLQIHFRKKECYLDLLETFHEITQKALLGQSMDVYCGQKQSLNLFTMNKYDAIVKYKTSYYVYWTPFKLGMYLAGHNPELHRQEKDILIKMGHYYQVQDDFIDTYGDPGVIGEIGTDIQEGKSSWLAVIALQRATPSQRQIMEECYGCEDPDKVARVKQLYDDLGLPMIYAHYEKTTCDLLNTQIQKITWGPLRDLLFKFLSITYGRVK